MARAGSFKTHAMARIWEELRYAPGATLARLAAHAEDFAGQVAPLDSYPEALVEERITHYRADRPRDGDVLAGDALLADLAVFVELATARAPLPREVRGGALTLKAAARELGVSATTLRRYRDRGLMLHHVWSGSGAGRATRTAGATRTTRAARVELCVFADSLHAFARANSALVARAAGTGRLSKNARAELSEHALAQLSSGAASVNQLAKQFAASTGRSARTVRRALQLDAQVSARTRSNRRRADPESEARIAARAWQSGFSPQQIAARRALSVPACTRAVQRGRYLELRAAAQHLAPFVLPTFTRADAADTLLAPPAVRQQLPAGDWVLPAPRLSSRHTGWTAAVIAHHFLLWRAMQTVRGARRPDTPALDSAERDLRWAYRLRRGVVQAALPDALARVAQHLGSPWKRVPQELQVRWACAAARAAAHALEFRQLASVAIDDVHPLRAVALAVERMLTRPDVDELIGSTVPLLDAMAIAPWMAHIDSGDRWVAVLPALAPGHRDLIARRFGLDGAAPATVEELAPLVRGSASVAQGKLYAALAAARGISRAQTRGR